MKKMLMRSIAGQYQAVIESAEDLIRIMDLDEAFWMATGASVDAFCADPALISFIDQDGDGRILVGELRAAVSWLAANISDRSVIGDGRDHLPLSAIDDSHDEGRALKTSAKRVLTNLGVADDMICLEHVRDCQSIMSSGEHNGDGVIPLAAVSETPAADLAAAIARTIGAVSDKSGQSGIAADSLDKFLSEAQANLDWVEKADDRVMIWGAETCAAYDTLAVLDAKMEEFFLLCRAAAVDGSRGCVADAPGKCSDADSLSAVAEMVESAPIGVVNPRSVLDFNDYLNPAWAARWESFHTKILATLKIGENGSFSYADWLKVKSLFASHAEWRSAKAGEVVESLGVDKLRALMAPAGIDYLRGMIVQDTAVAGELKAVGEVERLILFKRWLIDFANNFVSLTRFFDPSADSMIQAGRLVIDGRHFSLAVKVPDMAFHKRIVPRSNICVMYLEIKDVKASGGTDEMTIAVGVTSGDMGNIFVGKAGVFHSRDGREWDAKVLEIIRQPVSIGEALVSPFIKLGDFIRRQTERFTGSRYDELEKSVGAHISQANAAVSAATAAPAKSSAWGGGASMLLLGGGVSIAAVGSAFAYVAKTISSVNWEKIGYASLIVLLVIFIPITVTAWLKLRKRNIAAFLEASGWAVNHPMRLSRLMGIVFTHAPPFPDWTRRRRFNGIGRMVKVMGFQDNSSKSRALVIAALLLLIMAVIAYLLLKIYNI